MSLEQYNSLMGSMLNQWHALAKLRAEICSNLVWDDLITLLVWVDKENSIEFSFAFLYTTYTLSVFTLIYKVPHISFESSSLMSIDLLRKEKKIDIDLVIWSSHDTTPLSKFLVLRIFFIVHSRGWPYFLLHCHLLLSTLLFPNFPVQFLPPLPLSFLLFFAPFSFLLSIISSSFPTFPSTLRHTFYLTTQLTFLLWTILAILPFWTFPLLFPVSWHPPYLFCTLFCTPLLLP